MIDIQTLALGDTVALTFGPHAGEPVSIEAIHYADSTVDIFHGETETFLSHVALAGLAS